MLYILMHFFSVFSSQSFFSFQKLNKSKIQKKMLKNRGKFPIKIEEYEELTNSSFSTQRLISPHYSTHLYEIRDFPLNHV